MFIILPGIMTSPKPIFLATTTSRASKGSSLRNDSKSLETSRNETLIAEHNFNVYLLPSLFKIYSHKYNENLFIYLLDTATMGLKMLK